MGYTTTTGNLGGQNVYNTSSLSDAVSCNLTESSFRSTEAPATKSGITRGLTSRPTFNSARPQGSTIKAQQMNMNVAKAPESENGITVAGSESDQKFSYGSWFATEATAHVIVLKLVGKVGEQVVEKPITVQQKPVCSTCGKINKATFRFCGRCGTSLTLF
jgi:hypothetical protein